MFSTKIDTRLEYVPGDPVLIKNIVSQLKSQGVFDQFRKECISDVDTKPAYQNLCHRVDGRVESYLSDTKWGPHLNKNQLRENIRKHVNECTFVDSGISRIVDQLVNPRINTVLVPKVEDIVYNYLGIERPDYEKYQMNGAVLEKTNVFIEKRKGDTEELASMAKSGNHYRISLSHQVEIFSNKDNVIESENGAKQETRPAESTNQESNNACSDIESDDDISPPFEPHEKSDVDLSGDSDFSMDISDTKYDCKSEVPPVVKLDTDNDKIFQNLGRICGDESVDSATSSFTDKVNSRKPSLSLDLPNTPTINYETSDDSQDDHFKKDNSTNVCGETVQNEICIPDGNSADLCVEKLPDHQGENSSNSAKDVCIAVKEETKDQKGREDADSNLEKKNEICVESKDSKRSEKHSDRKKDIRRTDKHESSRSDKDRKSSRDKDKDRSNHDSKNRTSKDTQNHHRKEHVRDSEKSKNHEKSSKDRDLKHRESSKSSSSNDKSRSSSSRVKSDDSKDDRRKKSSSSRHDSEKDRERSKHRKEDSSEAKKNKTQCSTENKKTRTDRRSSDRDSNGPSSSSRSSSHRSSSKTDKEKHRHSSSSSSSSSHKSKKTAETKDSAQDALYDSMVSVTGSALPSSESLPLAKVSNIENTSSLLDILNDNDESKTSRPNASAHSDKPRKSSSSAQSKETRREDDDAKKKENRRKKEESKTSESSVSCTYSRKSSSTGNEPSDAETKKPKIARNAADIRRIIELRKQYKVKTDQLSQVQGKENTNLETRRELPTNETDQKSILSERSIDNYVVMKTDRSEKSADEILSDSFSDCKLKIKRIDTDYRLVNGSVVIEHAHNESNTVDKIRVDVKDSDVKGRNEDFSEENRLKQYAQIQSNDAKVNGLLKDVNIPKVVDVRNEKGRGCDVNETRPTMTKTCSLEETDGVRYFEPAELNADFRNFVAKRIKESEEMYLENFSIHLKCPERYDYIFVNQLGAQVKRKQVKSETVTSPFKYNSEIIDNKRGNEKGIMMRIKKTVSEEEMFTPPFGISYSEGSQNAMLDEISSNSSTDSSNKFPNKKTSAKRKTLGVKRSLSITSKVTTSGTPAKIVKLNHHHDMNGLPSMEKSNTAMQASKNSSFESTEDGSQGSLSNDQISYQSTSNIVNHKSGSTNSGSALGHSTPKVHKPMSQEQKRKQFYYDANDLYKPRPSFLVSSRRSRGLNPDKT